MNKLREKGMKDRKQEKGKKPEKRMQGNYIARGGINKHVMACRERERKESKDEIKKRNE